MIKFAKLRIRYLVTGRCFVPVNVSISISALSYMFDVARVNMMTVSYVNKGLTLSEAKPDESFTEEWKLAVALIKPRMVYRLNNNPNLTDCLRKSTMHFLGRRAAIHPPVDPQFQNPKSVAPYLWMKSEGKVLS